MSEPSRAELFNLQPTESALDILVNKINMRFKIEVGSPELRPLDPKKVELANKLRAVANAAISEGPPSKDSSTFSPMTWLKGVLHKATDKEESEQWPESTWYLYCLLNLESLIKSDIAEQFINEPTSAEAIIRFAKAHYEITHNATVKATRFGHVAIAQGTLPVTNRDSLQIDPRVIVSAVKALFKPENRFPWIDNKNRISTNDKRMQTLENCHPIFLDTTQTDKMKDSSAFQNILASREPLIIYESSQRPIDIGAYVSLNLGIKPFVIIIKDNNGIQSLQIISNHKYFDGIPAAFYMNQLITRLGLKYMPPEEVLVANTELLLNTLKDADEHENSVALDESYDIKSTVLSADFSNDIWSLYNAMLKKNEYSADFISFETFLQILLFNSNHVDGQTLLGGSLKFDPLSKNQLDHIAVGNMQEVLKALLNNDKKWLTDNGYLFGKAGKEKFGLFRKGQSNIQGVINLIRYLVPRFSWQAINKIFKDLGMQMAFSGQLMSSQIPQGIHRPAKNGLPAYDIDLAGIGGPAETEFQDGAYTIYISEKRTPPLIIIRRKFRKLASADSTLPTPNPGSSLPFGGIQVSQILR